MLTKSLQRYIALTVVAMLIIHYRYFFNSKDASLSEPTKIVTPAKTETKTVIKTNQESLYMMYGGDKFKTTQKSLYTMYGEGNFTRDDDEHLLNYIRSMMSRQGPGGYHLENPSRVHYNPKGGGSKFVDELLNKRRNGFFVECGAFTGEGYSDTLFFERQRNWTGLLIEANPEYHREILKKNRRALVLRGCLSPSPLPGLMKFRLAGWGSGVSALNKNVKADDKTVPEIVVQCFSLNSIMAAIGVRHIDYFVLDVEGAELSILETIDWKRLSIDVFNIEYNGGGGPNATNRIQTFRHFFREVYRRTGLHYKEVGQLPFEFRKDRSQDVVFMRL